MSREIKKESLPIKLTSKQVQEKKIKAVLNKQCETDKYFIGELQGTSDIRTIQVIEWSILA
jgi:hypothetical protein